MDAQTVREYVEVVDLGIVYIHRDHVEQEGNKEYIRKLHSEGHPYCAVNGDGNVYAVFPDGSEVQIMGRAEPEFRRVSGETICDMCHLTYYRHKWSEHLGYDNRPYLHTLCNGELVKL
jgi:hypothetical protein